MVGDFARIRGPVGRRDGRVGPDIDAWWTLDAADEDIAEVGADEGELPCGLVSHVRVVTDGLLGLPW